MNLKDLARPWVEEKLGQVTARIIGRMLEGNLTSAGIMVSLSIGTWEKECQGEGCTRLDVGMRFSR